MPPRVKGLAETAAGLLADARRSGGSALVEVAELIGTRFDSGCLIYVSSLAQGGLVPVAGGHPDRAVSGSIAELIGRRPEATRSSVAATIERGEVVAVSGTADEIGALFAPPVAAHVRSRDMRGILGVPVTLAHTVVGGILIGRDSNEPALGAGERTALERLAEGLSEALDHERLARDVGALAEREHLLHDPLTGLPSRALLTDALTRALARRARTGTTLALLRLEVDRFRDFEDSLGPQRGDELLRAVARRLPVRAADTPAHLGGCEFAILCENVTAERGAIEVAERVIGDFREPVVVDGRELHVTVSIGVSVVGGGAVAAETLLHDAAVALGRAKVRPGSSYELFDGEMRRRLLARLDLEDALRSALRDREFVLHYQPLVSLDDGRIIGVEALVRWQHPEQGLVAPGEFIPVAEESGLIVPLGRWVLDEACRRLAQWAADPALRDVSMSVNLSGRQLAAPDLPQMVEETLARTGVAPERLVLELTESVLMEETTVLQRLRASGVRLALDDFGTGYASLNYLKRFPLDAIKVDRSFIAGISERASDRHILRAIVRMAAALDLEVVAEGVETHEQATWLASIGCQVAQGFGLARPAPADVTHALLRSGLPPERRPGRRDLPAATAPDGPLPRLAGVLEAGFVADIARSLHEPGRTGWLATPGGIAAFAEWTGAVVAACRAGGYDTALDATRRLSARADSEAVTLLERHLLLEHVGELAAGRLREGDATDAELAAAGRLLTRLRHSLLEA